MGEAHSGDRQPKDNLTEMNTGDRKNTLPQRQGPGSPPAGGQPGRSGRWIAAFFLLTFLFNILSMSFITNGRVPIEYSQFVRLVESGNVKTVRIEPDQLLFWLKGDLDAATVAKILSADEGEPEGSAEDAAQVQRLLKSAVYYTGRVDDPSLTKLLLDNKVEFFRPIERANPIVDFISTWIIPVVIMYFTFHLLSKVMGARTGAGGMGGLMGVGKSKAKKYDLEASTGVNFADVAGQDEAKESLMEIVDYLHDPAKYQRIGAKQPKGALLVGPPGTGKTLLAKAVAGEAKVAFFSLSGSEFVEMFVGVGASRVRDLFEEAKKAAPCIIFIDEIDAIGKSRDSQMGGNDEREQTLNQLLAEMDGFDGSRGIVVLAATNRPETLDKALLRPGRFDRRVIVEKPDLAGREAILKVHAAKVKLGADIDLREIALATSGATGADLANMINEGALRAVRMNRAEVMQEDLMEAVEVVIAGKEKKDRIMNGAERRRVAFHEVGHALAGALQKDSAPVQKITIVPRTMGSLGYTMQVPEEERYLLTEGELKAQIIALLSGRAAEEVAFGDASTGASNDIERATQLARSMVTQYGMSDKFGMMGLESTQNQYLDGRKVLTCSEATGASIDEEVRGIIAECYDAATALVSGNRAALDRISEYLLEKETISGETFMRMLKG
ncbi:MAG: ATP-dependent zinc metalloprotease FtsH [Eubacteriales bacterium]|nr:ATP-dependent zinc metalloprotease FtsH [Christensenellaceae bacterium]MEA5065368.1 ATP-dependent zinc metalloprotease FtsH [Eubacteriales bacterium]